jgi:hypothetical protein
MMYGYRFSKHTKICDSNSLYNVNNMVAARKKKKFDLTRIRSCDCMRTRPVHFHRTNMPYDLSLLIYVT